MSPALATSGACSGHGGVSCSAGSDSDGSVICSDGWRNSSVAYSSMRECSVTSVYVPSCSSPTTSDCDVGSQTAINARRGLLGSSMGDAAIAQCQATHDAFILSQSIYQTCIANQYSSLYPVSVPTPSPILLTNASNTDQPLTQAIQRQEWTVEGEFSAMSCPALSDRASSGNCKCHPGFVAVLSSCVPVQTYCSARIGAQSEWNFFEKQCACKSGSVIDANTHQCRSLAEVCRERLGLLSVVDLPDHCKCAQGTVVDAQTGKCESLVILDRRRALTESSIPTTTPTIVATTTPLLVVENASTSEATVKTVSPLIQPRGRFVQPKSRQKVRVIPSLRAALVGTAIPNTRYELLEQKGEWIKIQFGEKTGWIKKSAVSLK